MSMPTEKMIEAVCAIVAETEIKNIDDVRAIIIAVLNARPQVRL